MYRGSCGRQAIAALPLQSNAVTERGIVLNIPIKLPEKVSVVNLLFSGTRQAVRKVMLGEDVLEKVFEVKNATTDVVGGEPRFRASR